MVIKIISTLYDTGTTVKELSNSKKTARKEIIYCRDNPTLLCGKLRTTLLVIFYKQCNSHSTTCTSLD